MMKNQAKTWGKFVEQKVFDSKLLVQKLQPLRSHQTIATINGSFDLLHAGHMYILYEASKQADILVVALNSDRSVQEYKGKTRPIIPLAERMQMVAALGFVDFVTWFNELTPCQLLEQIQPHVHVNGAEYGEDCVEAQTVKKYGGTLFLVPRIPALSTSQLISRIQTCE